MLSFPSSISFLTINDNLQILFFIFQSINESTSTSRSNGTDEFCSSLHEQSNGEDGFNGSRTVSILMMWNRYRKYECIRKSWLQELPFFCYFITQYIIYYYFILFFTLFFYSNFSYIYFFSYKKILSPYLIINHFTVDNTLVWLKKLLSLCM